MILFNKRHGFNGRRALGRPVKGAKTAPFVFIPERPEDKHHLFMILMSLEAGGCGDMFHSDTEEPSALDYERQLNKVSSPPRIYEGRWGSNMALTILPGVTAWMRNRLSRF